MLRRYVLDAADVLRGRRRVYYGWWILAVSVLSMTVASGLANWSLGLFVRPLEEEFGWSRAQVSIGFSISILTSGVAGPFVGRWVDQRGPRSAIVTGSALLALSYLLLASTNALWQWYLFSGVSAVFRQMMFFIPFQTLVSRWFDRRRGSAMSILGTGFSLGGFLIVPVVALVIGEFGWRGGFVFAGVLTAVVFLPAGLLVIRNQPADVGAYPDGEPPHERAGGRVAHSGITLAQAMRLPLFWVIAFGLMLYFSGVIGWSVHVVPFFESRGLSRETAALLVSVASGLGIVSRLAMGVFADRVRRFEATVVALVACLVLAMASPLAMPGLGGDLAFLAFWTIGTSAGPLAEALILTRAFGLANFATILGAVVVIETAGEIASPALAGAIFDSTGSYDVALVLYSFVFTGSAALFTLAARMKRPVLAEVA